MLLNDIGKSPATTFTKINRHLEKNFGFKISESIGDKDLLLIIEQLEDEITDLKIRGDDAKTSTEISKRLLVLEGLRNLRENEIIQLQSPKLESVVKGLSDFVVDCFGISGMCDQDYENAVRRAMDEYRSSRYRFPDDFIESRVREDSMSRIRQESVSSQHMESADTELTEARRLVMQDDDGAKSFKIYKDLDWGEYVVQFFVNGRHMPEADYHTDDKNDAVGTANYFLNNNRVEESVNTLSADNTERLKENTMKEASLVKNLRRLLETQVSQAEVMMASKGFAQELQEMIEKIGRLQNEDLPPVTDQMRETYGTDSASAFQTQIYGALQSVMNALYTAKGQVDDAVTNMAETGTFSAGIDMEKSLDDVDSLDSELSSMDADLDNISADDADDFGAADTEEPLGRAKKTEENSEALKQKVEEMKKLVAKAKKLREQKRQ